MRSMVRWEAVLIGVLGSAVGMLAGVGLSVAVVRALRDYGLVTYALPRSGLALITVSAVVVGVLAAIRPARRASGLAILEAIGGDR